MPSISYWMLSYVVALYAQCVCISWTLYFYSYVLVTPILWNIIWTLFDVNSSVWAWLFELNVNDSDGIALIIWSLFHNRHSQ